MVDVDARGEIAGGILGRLVADDDDLVHAFRRDLLRDQCRRDRAVDRLSAGHRHRIVVEDLVGDVDFGGDRGADREDPRVVIRAVAEIGEHVLGRRERRLADPRHAFAAHVGKGRSRARPAPVPPAQGCPEVSFVVSVLVRTSLRPPRCQWRSPGRGQPPRGLLLGRSRGPGRRGPRWHAVGAGRRGRSAAGRVSG